MTGKKRSREVTTETSTNERRLNLVEGGSKITSRLTLCGSGLREESGEGNEEGGKSVGTELRT